MACLVASTVGNVLDNTKNLRGVLPYDRDNDAATMFSREAGVNLDYLSQDVPELGAHEQHMASTVGTPTQDQTQPSEVETYPTSVSSGEPSREGMDDIHGVPNSSIGAMVSCDSGTEDTTLAAVGAQFAEAAATGIGSSSSRLSASAHNHKSTIKETPGPRFAGAVDASRQRAAEQDTGLRNRVHRNGGIGVDGEEQRDQAETTRAIQQLSPTRRVLVSSSVAVSVLTFGLMIYGLLYLDTRSPTARKGVLWGGIFALNFLAGCGMYAGSRSLGEYLVLATLVVTMGLVLKS